MSANIIKNGFNTSKEGKKVQKMKCLSCLKHFQSSYTYSACLPSTKRSILEHAIRSNGIRDIRALVRVSFYSIYKVLEAASKTLTAQKQNYDRILIDECYVIIKRKRKSQKRYITYAYAPETGEILALTIGGRTKKQVVNILTQLKALNITIQNFCTDDWKPFIEAIAQYTNINHLVGKQYTNPIEGINTLLRTRLKRLNRRTTAFSKSTEPLLMLLKIFAKKHNDSKLNSNNLNFN
jgi:IS1 family transposase